MKAFAIGSGLFCATALCVSVSAPASAMNLVVNGGFENPGLKSGTWNYYGAGQVEGWTPTQGSTIEIRNNIAGTAYEGSHFVEVDSHNYKVNAAEIGLFQDIVTTIGKQYKLSFAYGPREQKNVNGDNKLSVSFGDLFQELDAGNYQDGWQLFSQTITATDTVTRLKFLSTGKRDTLGANIDAVAVEAVPEPFSIVGLAAIGAIGVAGTARKRFCA